MFQGSLNTVSYILKYFWNPKICLKESSISKLLYRTLKIIFYVLNYNFSYIKLSFVFLLQNDSYSDTDDIMFFFFFFFRKILVPFPYFFLKFSLFFWQYLLPVFMYVHKKIINIFLTVINCFYIYTYMKLFKSHLNCFKYNISVFINISKHFREYIRTENPSNKIA